MDGDSIVAVQIRGGLKGYEISFCSKIFAREGMVLERDLKTLFESADLHSDRFVAQIPDKKVFFRNLPIPFKDHKKIRQTLPFEMETLVPLPVEELVTDFMVADGPGGVRIITASTTRETIGEYLAVLQTCGMVPHLLEVRGASLASSVINQSGTSDHALVLDMGAVSVSMTLFINRQMVLIRTLSFKNASLPDLFMASENSPVTQAFREEEVEAYFRSMCTAIRNTIHGFQYTAGDFVAPEKVFFAGPGSLLPGCGDFLTRFLEIPAVEIDLCGDNRIRISEEMAGNWRPALMSNALSLAMRGAGKGFGFNLLRDEFQVKKSLFGNKKEWRKVAIFLLIIFLFFGADMAVDYYSLKSRYNALGSEMVRVFKMTFPDISRIVDPVQQMKVEIQGLKRKGVAELRMESNKGALDLLKEISRSIPKSLDLTVTRMVIDSETVSLKGKTGTFNSVDIIKNGLSTSSLFSSVNISSANLDRTGKMVKFEMKLMRKP